MSRNRTEPMADLPDGPILHDGPEQRLLDGELAERLAGLLQLLPPRQGKVLVLRIAVGLSAEETAEELGTSPGAVRVTQHRALNLWVPETRLTPAHLLLLRRWRPGMIRRWRCG